MPDVKTSALDAATLPLDLDANIAPIVQGSANKKVALRHLRSRRTPPYIAGKKFILNPGKIQLGAMTALPATDVLYLIPFQVDSNDVPWKGITLRLGTAGGSGAALKAALWAIDLTVLEPRGLPVAADNTGRVATGTNVDVDLLFPADYTPVQDAFMAVGIVGNSASPMPSLLYSLNSNTFTPTMLGIGVGNSAGGTFSGWTLAQTYTNDIGALNITSVTATAATYPIPMAKT